MIVLADSDFGIEGDETQIRRVTFATSGSAITKPYA